MRKISPYHGGGILCYTKDTEGTLWFLLGKRNVKRGYGKWSIPGGSWEKKDGLTDKRKNYEMTARRETLEEMGIKVGSISPLWKSRVPFFQYQVFSSHLPKAEAVTKISEFSQVGWFTLKELPTPLVPFVHLQIRALTKKVKHSYREEENI